MSVSKEQIREYCRIKYVENARSLGDTHVTIRSSDVSSVFQLEPNDPIVCEALWSNEFEYENYLFRVFNNCQRENGVSIMVYRILDIEDKVDGNN